MTRPGRPSPDLSGERRSLAIDLLRRDPGIAHADLAAQLGIGRPAATRLVASLRAASLVPPAPPPTGPGVSVRLPAATVALVDGLRRPGKSRGDVVREAVEALAATGKIGRRADRPDVEVAEYAVIGPDGRPTGERVWIGADGRRYAE